MLLIFCTLLISSSFMVILSKNPIYSAFFLILSFCNSCNILLFLGLDYLALTTLLIYIGAISILFLFVLMLINLGVIELRNHVFQLAPILTAISGIFLIFNFTTILFKSSPINKSFIYSEIIPMYTEVSDNLELTSIYKLDVNIKTLGLLIYSEFSQFLFLAALLLLLAMIGTIYLSYLKTFNLK